MSDKRNNKGWMIKEIVREMNKREMIREIMTREMVGQIKERW